ARLDAGPPAWRPRRAPRRSRERAMGPAQLRPLDVRGRAACDRADSVAVAPALPEAARRVCRAACPQRRGAGFRFVTGSIRSSGGASASTPPRVSAKPSFSRSCGLLEASTVTGESSLGGPSMISAKANMAPAIAAPAKPALRLPELIDEITCAQR